MVHRRGTSRGGPDVALSRVLPACTRAGTGLFALGLLFSAVAKSLGPGAAAAGMVWTHLGHAQRIALVLLAVFVETLVGGLLLAMWRCRLVLWSGAALAAVLLFLHTMVMASSSRRCGCFGEVPVPDGVSLSLPGLGLLGCTAALRTANAILNPKRFGCILLMAIVVPALAASGLSSPPTSTAEELRSSLGIGPGERAVALVGTWSCDECERALLDLLDRPVTGRRVYFVTRVSERLSPRLDTGTFVPATIPDALWWRVVTSTPPVLVDFGSAAVARGP